jgi:hypothetical protein
MIDKIITQKTEDQAARTSTRLLWKGKFIFSILILQFLHIYFQVY